MDLDKIRDYKQFFPLWNNTNFRQACHKKFGTFDKTDEVVLFFLDYWVEELSKNWPGGANQHLRNLQNQKYKNGVRK